MKRKSKTLERVKIKITPQLRLKPKESQRTLVVG